MLRNSRFAAVAAVLLAALTAGVVVYRGADQKPQEKVVIAHSRLPFAALAQIAQQQGFYSDEGLEAEPVVFNYGKLALEAVVAGRADFATVAETPTMFAIMNGAPVTIVATIQVSKESHAIVARRDSGVASPEQLVGKRMAVTLGTSGAFYLDAFLLTREIPRDRLDLVDMKPEALPGALARGDVDAVVTWPPYLMQAQKEAGSNGVTFLDDEIYTLRYNVVTSKDLVRQHPEKVRSMLRALLRAEEFARSNPLDSQRLVADFCGMDLQTVTELWEASTFRVSLEQGLLLSLEDESQWAVANGLTRNRFIPNYLEFVYLDGLRSVAPKAVGISR